jgi:hypothetical protein
MREAGDNAHLYADLSVHRIRGIEYPRLSIFAIRKRAHAGPKNTEAQILLRVKAILRRIRRRCTVGVDI